MPNNTVTPGTLAYEALTYASRGIRIFPLWHTVNGTCECKDGPTCKDAGKHPRVRYGVNAASARETQIEQWWTAWPDANIGLPAGDNGLAVIDVDPRHGGDGSLAKLVGWCQNKYCIDLMATRIIRTGSGGLHLYFRQPPGGIKSARRTFGGDGLDTRGVGGYVIAPPSLHACGGRYEMVDDREPARWPAVLDRLINPHPSPAQRTAAVVNGTRGAGTRWATAALTAECEALQALPQGEGNGKNQALNTAAYKMGRRVAAGFLDENATADALYDAARGWHGHGERELRATIRSGMQAGMRDPHPGPTTRHEAP